MKKRKNVEISPESSRLLERERLARSEKGIRATKGGLADEAIASKFGKK